MEFAERNQMVGLAVATVMEIAAALDAVRLDFVAQTSAPTPNIEDAIMKLRAVAAKMVHELDAGL